MKQLIAYDYNLRIGECCAKPTNRVRLAELGDIIAWIDERDLWDTLLNEVPYGRLPNFDTTE